MTTDTDTTLPRWGGITERMTALTNVVLAALAFVFYRGGALLVDR